MRNLLITGFEPFGGSRINPTEALMASIREESFPGAAIHTLLLPVVFGECAERLKREIDRLQPDAVLCCGLAAGRAAVTPERIAVNAMDVPAGAAFGDNDGNRPQDEPIRAGGPDGLFATLPIRRIELALRAAGIPASISDTAGLFICNNTMYAALDHVRDSGSGALAGFIHFPASTELALDKPGLPSLPQSMLHDALRIAIAETLAELDERSGA
ncbi:pyroglutamyl-peptidase I [Paenibacillus pasadenensis]|uniref:Pyroglutamyl-peptidase I n=1 Tax=Paenibacillus pasadenensis TaxID=217090 RepID=A0A2N5N2A7_9BACL|nr:pyroglutamyl-peptidase I [Paenibacillus pasadenensis]PLT44459.1 Pyrrolidone-carboxylate peptidase [Paenibacillus pasadenensis]